MTDTTDTKALKPEPLCFLVQQESRNGPDCYVECHDGYRNSQAVYSAEQMQELLDQFEAERQRADDAEGELRSEVMKNLLTTDCMRKAHRKIAEMEGEQEPIAYLTRHIGCRAPDDCEEYLEVSDKDGVSGNGESAIPVFTSPPKPVVLRPNLHPSHSYASVAVSGRDEQWYAAIEAAGGVVSTSE